MLKGILKNSSKLIPSFHSFHLLFSLLPPLIYIYIYVCIYTTKQLIKFPGLI